MGLLDRFLNPAWDEIARLPAPRQYELTLVITMPSAWNFSMRRTVVPVLEREVRRFVSNSSFQMPSDSIVRQLSAATLACCAVPLGRPPRSEHLDFAGLRSVAMQLLRAQSESDGLAVKDYSEDPDAARVQFLLWLADAIGIDDPQFTQRLSIGDFGREWSGTVSQGLSGLATGAGRSSESLLSQKAKQELKSMCSSGRAVISHLAKSKPSAMPRVPQSPSPSPTHDRTLAEKRVAEWRTASLVPALLEECKVRAQASARSFGDALAERYRLVPALLVPENFSGTAEQFRRQIMLPSIVNAYLEQALLVAFGTIVVRRSTGPRYFILAEWKELGNRFTAELIQIKREAKLPWPNHGPEETAAYFERIPETVRKEMVFVQAAIIKNVQFDGSQIWPTPRNRAQDVLTAAKMITPKFDSGVPGKSLTDFLTELLESTLSGENP